MKNKNILQHDHVFLRAMEPEDLDVLYNWENDSDNWLVSNTITPFSKFTLDQFISSSNQDIYQSRQLRMMIINKQDGKAIGAIDLFDFDPFHLRAGIGILIGEKNERKKGYASEALEVIISYAGKVLLLKQLYCNIAENNEHSLDLFIDKSFILSGKKIDWIKTDDGFLTEFFLQLQLF